MHKATSGYVFGDRILAKDLRVYELTSSNEPE